MNYKNTLNLPYTKFPMRANLTQLEIKTIKYWYDQNLYKKLCNIQNNSKIFILHDGPPYANGNIHIGHAVNKILKDFILKFKRLMGYHAPYIPGWDCHGLPIELEVEKIVDFSKNKISAAEFRCACRNHAIKQIKRQKKEFIRLGVLSDWDNHYMTMDFSTEANIIRILGKVIENGYLYKGNKPVHWCINCKSALAETEIEYYDFSSTAIYVTFVAKNVNQIIAKFNNINFSGPIALVIWTTTPWTLPVNKAIAINPNYIYNLILVNGYGFILSCNLVKNIMKNLGLSNWKILGSIKGKELELLHFNHPFMNFSVPVILSNHVTDDCGTGAVHIAPSHGYEDYIISKYYKLELNNLIDDHGKYIIDYVPLLNGKNVFEVNEIIINLLHNSNSLLKMHDVKHSYPHCWRHKKPTIFRATEQWFISMDKNDLRKKSLAEIKNVKWIPNWSQKLIEKMIINRPDWCISRQRKWGVPMTLFLHNETGALHPRTSAFIEDIAKLVEKFGIQAWWDLDKKKFLGKDHVFYKKVLDTLDVWFDSGSTFFSVVSTRPEFFNKFSNLYLEGLDQHRGWFLSSLMISIMINNQAPYKKVITHGFTVDNNGKKMSKSLGNIISPQQITNTLGADILRLWVASTNYTNEITLSNEILKRITDIYRRIRNTARFLLANLNNFNPEIHMVNPTKMIKLDLWIINRAKFIQEKIIESYDNYKFHDVIKYILHFCSIEMGSCYLDIIKDRQYTNKLDSLACRSCQTAIFHITEAMVRWIAPIISFTADEIWKFIPGKKSQFVFTEKWYEKLFFLDDSKLMNNKYWESILEVRSKVNRIIEQARVDKYIKHSLEASIKIYAETKLAEKLRVLGNELCFMLLTSHVEIFNHNSDCDKSLEKPDKKIKIILKKAKGRKCKRCWHYKENVGKNLHYPDICERCINNMIGPGEKRKFI